MWTIAGSIAIISFVVSPVGQKIIRPLLTQSTETSMMLEVRPLMSELY